MGVQEFLRLAVQPDQLFLVAFFEEAQPRALSLQPVTSVDRWRAAGKRRATSRRSCTGSKRRKFQNSAASTSVMNLPPRAIEIAPINIVHQLSFSPSRKVRSSRPSRPVFRISVASMNEPLLTEVLVPLVAPGLAYSGVLSLLQTSAPIH